MFLQKLVPFLPLPPKGNNSPACRPKTSKRCHTTTQPATKNLCCRSCWPLLLSAALSAFPNPSAGASASCRSIAPLLVGWLLCCPVAFLRLLVSGSPSCQALHLLVVAWRCIVMPVPLTVPPMIFNALVVSPTICATAAACIVVFVAIQVVMTASLAFDMEGDDGGLAAA